MSISRKVYKFHMGSVTGKRAVHKKVSQLCASQARKPHAKTAKTAKDTSTKAKRVMRDMLVFWRKNEREERDGRKRAEKEALDRAKEEEEKREAQRQARKLEFLISQTELYSHFVGNKLKSELLMASCASLY
jgi:DNA helicase INO80